jgi:hypothetical protein
MYNAGNFALAAADAFIIFKEYAAALAFYKCVTWANFHTCRLAAAKADDCYKAAVYSACRTYFYRTFNQRMVTLIDYRTDAHACETAQAFPHLGRLKYFWH